MAHGANPLSDNRTAGARMRSGVMVAAKASCYGVKEGLRLSRLVEILMRAVGSEVDELTSSRADSTYIRDTF